jgi:PAS domain S-box-containing protein
MKTIIKAERQEIVVLSCVVSVVILLTYAVSHTFSPFFLIAMSLWSVLGLIIAFNTNESWKDYVVSVQLTILAGSAASLAESPTLLPFVLAIQCMVLLRDIKALLIPLLTAIAFPLYLRSMPHIASILLLFGTFVVVVYLYYLITLLRKEKDSFFDQLTSAENLAANHLSFVHAFSEGKYDQECRFSKDDELGTSLYQMGLKLQRTHEEEKIASWQMNGFNELNSILQRNTDMTDLYAKVVSFLTRYLNANQGALFILNAEDPHDVVLVAKGCYAYDRQKNISGRVPAENGLLGECVVEKQMIYIEKIPQNYVRITSGLGYSTPSSLIIVPIKHNDHVNGVVEIASFNKLKAFERDFLKKAGEIIGAAVTTFENNQETATMLKESQQMAEELKTQQEEVRQNMEELEATQEYLNREVKEKERLQAELKKSQQFLNLVIDSIPLPVFAKDRKHRMVLLNKAVCELNNRSREEMLGKTDFDFFTRDEAAVFWSFEEEIFDRKTIAEKIEHAFRNGKETYTLDKKLAVTTDDGEEFLIGVNIDVTYAEMMKRRGQDQYKA